MSPMLFRLGAKSKFRGTHTVGTIMCSYMYDSCLSNGTLASKSSEDARHVLSWQVLSALDQMLRVHYKSPVALS
eukprot:scaffold426314_cov15-Prasinocladus_malaysianus.AAC.1